MAKSVGIGVIDMGWMGQVHSRSYKQVPDRIRAVVEKKQGEPGFNRYFHANFKADLVLVDEGRIGQPHLVRISSRGSARPKISDVQVAGGISLDMTIHNLAMALPLFDLLDLWRDSFVAELESFLDAVQQDTEPLVIGLDGRYPLLMGLAAPRSLRENRPVKHCEIE